MKSQPNQSAKNTRKTGRWAKTAVTFLASSKLEGFGFSRLKIEGEIGLTSYATVKNKMTKPGPFLFLKSFLGSRKELQKISTETLTLAHVQVIQ